MIGRCMPAGVFRPRGSSALRGYCAGFSSLYFSWYSRGFLPGYRRRRLWGEGGPAHYRPREIVKWNPHARLLPIVPEVGGCKPGRATCGCARRLSSRCISPTVCHTPPLVVRDEGAPASAKLGRFTTLGDAGGLRRNPNGPLLLVL